MPIQAEAPTLPQRLLSTTVAMLVATLIAVLLTTAVPALADGVQEGAAKLDFGEMVEVSEVLLDVLVTDAKGNVVVGLTADDFVVEDQGAEIPISGASFYSNRFKLQSSVDGVQNPLANEVVADRHFIFFFHDSKQDTQPNDSRLLRRQFDAARFSRQWVEEEMLPGDWVAVVSYDLKLKIHQDFSQDAREILRGIESAATGKDPKYWKSRLPEDIPAAQPSLLRHLPKDPKQIRDRSTRIHEGMKLLANATRDIVGRKNLVLFSAGFADLRVIGRTNTTYSRTDPRFYPELEEALNDNNVATYVVDLTPSDVEAGQKDVLTQLADDTGGEYFGTFNNFLTPLRELADQSNGYYLISYQAEHAAGTTGYRNVKVRTKNPGFEVRARQGYRYGS